MSEPNSTRSFMLVSDAVLFERNWLDFWTGCPASVLSVSKTGIKKHPFRARELKRFRIDGAWV